MPRSPVGPFLLFCAAIGVVVALSADCGAPVTTNDFGVVVPGCRAPRACFAEEACLASCRRGIFDDPACKVCDPSIPGVVCTCSEVSGATPAEGVCRQPEELCVGRGVVCEGPDARCVPSRLPPDAKPDMSLCSAESEPPQKMVPFDGGPTIESRCRYADDICCNAITPDGGA
jgi:hypothetical protein